MNISLYKTLEDSESEVPTRYPSCINREQQYYLVVTGKKNWPAALSMLPAVGLQSWVGETWRPWTAARRNREALHGGEEENIWKNF